MSDLLKPVQVLHGHDSPDTGYLIGDYPYGFRLRCEIRYWVDTAVKGAAKGRQRFMSQTTNPKVAGRVWNKEKGSTYSDMVVMFLDEQEHVQQWGVDAGHMTPEGDALLRLRGVYGQFTDEQRQRYDLWQAFAVRRYAAPWQEWQETVFQLAGHIRDHGAEPTLDGNVWVTGGDRRYLGGERVQAAYFASARNLIAAG